MSQRGFSNLIVLVILVILGIFGGMYFFSRNTAKTSENFPPSSKQISNQNPERIQSWQEAGPVIPGTFADAKVVDLGNGNYRMYYSIEPEVPGNNLEVYSSISTDGINWTKEEGVRKTMAAFPDVVKLTDGSWRMYFQNAGVIKSAKSADGLNWTDEPGIRISKDEPGYELENVGAQGTIRLDDGTYSMAYSGTINQPYQTSEKLPNKDTHIYFWATSKDGLIFEKKGLAIDSRNETLFGAADGAEWVKWDDGNLRVYFWSYNGVYHVVYRDGTFSKPFFDFTNNKDKMVKFTPNPPSDPTLIKIGDTWFMYYGQHTKGIYLAKLK